MNWTSWRSLFPITSSMIFLDHAAVSPLPLPTCQAMREYMDDLSVRGSTACPRWDRHIETIRNAAAKLIAAHPKDIAFVANTTHGIGIVAEGFPWQPGDNMVTAQEEYPSNLYPWMNLKDRGVECRIVPSRGNRIETEDLLAAMDPHTRLVALSAVQYTSGFRHDLLTLGEICRSRGIFFAVDAIQALGAFPIQVRELPIDSLAACGHKWMLGPQGAGFCWIRSEWLDRLKTTGVGWNSVVGAHQFSNIDFRLKPNMGRFEGGTYNIAGLVGLGASLELLLSPGIDAISKRILELTDYLCEQIARTDWQVFSDRGKQASSGIVSLISPGIPPEVVMKKCLEAKCAVNVRAGRLRLSPHAYNTHAEIDQFIQILGS